MISGSSQDDLGCVRGIAVGLACGGLLHVVVVIVEFWGVEGGRSMPVYSLGLHVPGAILQAGAYVNIICLFLQSFVPKYRYTIHNVIIITYTEI